MKRFLLALVAVTLMMSACTNEDITISQRINFKIDPSTVIKPFTYQVNSGDLNDLGSTMKLRVRLLIYQDDLLVDQQTQYLFSYSEVMNTSVCLPVGSYTAIAITDVVRDSFEYWALSEEEKLSETRLADTGYLGYDDRILGISNVSFDAGNGQSSDITIHVAPAGALFCIRFLSIHQFTNVAQYTLLYNRNVDYCAFNYNGQYEVVPKNNDGSYDWRLCYINVADFPQSNIIYSYQYLLPLGKVNFMFAWTANSQTTNIFDSGMTIDAKAGDEYYVELDLCDETYENKITCYYELVNGNKAAGTLPVSGDSERICAAHSDNDVVYLKNLIE